MSRSFTKEKQQSMEDLKGLVDQNQELGLNYFRLKTERFDFD